MKRSSILIMFATIAFFNIALSNVVADSGGQYERVETFELDLNGQPLVLRNLVGEVQIKPTTDDQARVEATVVSDSKKNVDLINFDQKERSGKLEIRTLYPVDNHRNYIYQPSNTNGNYNTSLKYQGKKVRVTNKKGFRSGLRLHVDYVVYVPRNAEFSLTNAVGIVNAEDINGKLDLDTHQGPITASQGVGDIRLDTGSGRINVHAYDGNIHADTGSGGITIEKISGDVNADTGSGSVELTQIDGDAEVDTGSGSIDVVQLTGDLKADTGSGSVTIETASGSLHVDTGSGSVRARDYIAGDSIDIDTGSGRVTLDGDLSQVSNLSVDTGSGSIKLLTSRAPSMKLSVSANSNVDIDFPDMSDVGTSRGRFRGTLGDGAGRGTLETGSGSVTFSLR